MPIWSVVFSTLHLRDDLTHKCKIHHNPVLTWPEKNSECDPRNKRKKFKKWKEFIQYMNFKINKSKQSLIVKIKVYVNIFKWLIDVIWWMCLWCNGYHRRKWIRRHEFKSWTRLIAFHIVLIPLGKIWIQLFSLQLWVNSRTDYVLQPW